MNAPQTPHSEFPTLQERRELAAWVELRSEMTELIVRLETMKLLLKMGVKLL